MQSHWAFSPLNLSAESQFSISPHMASASVPSSSLWAFSWVSAVHTFLSSMGEPRIWPSTSDVSQQHWAEGKDHLLDLPMALLLMKGKGGNAKRPYLHIQRRNDVLIIVQNSSRFFLHISVHVLSIYLTKDCSQEPKLHKARASFVFKGQFSLCKIRNLNLLYWWVIWLIASLPQ